MVIATRPGSRTRVAGIIRFMVLLGPGRHAGGQGMCKPEGTGTSSLSYRRWSTGRGPAFGGLVSTGVREGAG